MSDLTIVEGILRDRADFFIEIRDQVNLGAKIQAMFTASFVFFAIYGAVMGLAHSPVQMLASLIKLPVLFLVTLLICTPSLHFFNILFGARQTFMQVIALVLTA
ncbi:MAG: hypothetical protein GYB67_05520, partial [Chloroflexi bacterium]|nr:hypothetical protein [Chloroflexota bacterium]